MPREVTLIINRCKQCPFRKGGCMTATGCTLYKKEIVNMGGEYVDPSYEWLDFPDFCKLKEVN